MSGGSLDYIQNADAEEFISGAHSDNLQAIVKDLVSYGEASKDARNATASVIAKIEEARLAYLKSVAEIDALISPLHDIWRQLDYCGSGDVSKEDVRKALEEYNRTHGKRS